MAPDVFISPHFISIAELCVGLVGAIYASCCFTCRSAQESFCRPLYCAPSNVCRPVTNIRRAPLLFVVKIRDQVLILNSIWNWKNIFLHSVIKRVYVGVNMAQQEHSHAAELMFSNQLDLFLSNFREHYRGNVDIIWSKNIIYFPVAWHFIHAQCDQKHTMWNQSVNTVLTPLVPRKLYL